MWMRSWQCGMCWCMRYRGGRLATELCRGDISGLVGYGCWLPWWALRTECCGAISPNLPSVRPHELVWVSLSLIPLANLVVVRGGYVLGWDLDWSRPGGLWATSRGWATAGCRLWRSRLWTVKCVWVKRTTSVECTIHSNGPCPRFGQVTVWTSQLVEPPSPWNGWLFGLP